MHLIIPKKKRFLPVSRSSKQKGTLKGHSFVSKCLNSFLMANGLKLVVFEFVLHKCQKFHLESASFRSVQINSNIWVCAHRWVNRFRVFCSADEISIFSGKHLMAIYPKAVTFTNFPTLPSILKVHVSKLPQFSENSSTIRCRQPLESVPKGFPPTSSILSVIATRFCQTSLKSQFSVFANFCEHERHSNCFVICSRGRCDGYATMWITAASTAIEE